MPAEEGEVGEAAPLVSVPRVSTEAECEAPGDEIPPLAPAPERGRRCDGSGLVDASGELEFPLGLPARGGGDALLPMTRVERDDSAGLQTRS